MTTWQTKKLDDVLDKVVYTKKIHRKKFLSSGKFPVVSQEQDFINGYWNNERDVFKVKKPVAIFGDHTQVLKYVDFDFVLGADGVKILQSKPFLDSKYFYYSLQNLNLKSLGYARHFRLLKDADISYPESLLEQKRIANKLDGIFEKVTKAREAVEKNLQNSKELFESYLQSVFANPGKAWEEKKLGEVCGFYNGKAHEKAIDAGGAYIVINSKFVSSNGEKYKKTKKMLFPLLKGDIAMVMSDVPNGKTLAKCFIVDKDNTYSLNQRVCTIRSHAFEIRFLYFQLNRHKYLLAFNNGENQTNLRKNDILNCPLFVPPLSEQKTIVKKLDALSMETKKLEKIYEQKLADLEELKKSVLKKAFCGKL